MLTDLPPLHVEVVLAGAVFPVDHVELLLAVSALAPAEVERALGGLSHLKQALLDQLLGSLQSPVGPLDPLDEDASLLDSTTLRLPSSSSFLLLSSQALLVSCWILVS